MDIWSIALILFYAFNLFNYDKYIPKLYRDAWLENCDKKIIELFNDDSKIEEKVKAGLYIYGSCGTGKTFALYSIFRNCKFFRMNCRIINTVELLRLFKKDFNNPRENNFEDYLDFGGILFIDDIGAEKNSEFVDETLYHLINSRNEQMLPTFFTSNLSIKELAEKNGDRIASRIVEMCKIIELKGDDKRIK